MIAALKLLHILLFHFVSLKLLALAQEQNQFIYNGFNGSNLHLNGIAKIHPNGLLELTGMSTLKIGRAFFPIPLKFNTSDGSRSLLFSTSFIFAIIPEQPDLGGHGITFCISPSMEFEGAFAASYFGLFNRPTGTGLSTNHVFAVELDTIESPEFQDINNNHVGIDVNSLISNASAPVSYFSDVEKKNKSLKLISGDPMQVWIDYDQVEKLLNVTIAPITSTKPHQPLLSTSVDLSLVLKDSMYVGFSSSTGSMASYHYILGWSFNKSGQAQSLDKSKLPPLPLLSSQRKSRKITDVKIMFPLITVIVVLMTISAGAYILRSKKFDELHEDWEEEYGPHRFSYKDLYKATKGFKDRELIGAGGFGRVYRGVLPSNMQVAVKKISHDSQQGMKEFVAEIVSMGKLRHRNLVRLLGYCRRKGELLLVYEHMTNGSLDRYLFSNETPNLDWVQRYQILRGVASALLYLHEEWEQLVLHRDVKASNILLDDDLNGRLGDFGLARFSDHGSNPQTTCVVGTVGYLAPEVTRTGKATTSSDVFAFGALMLETACGRKPIEPERSAQEMILADWVFECWRRGAILGTSDPTLEGNYVAEEMELVLKLGILCSHPLPGARPSMRQVVQYLDGNATLPGMPLTLDSPRPTSIGLLMVSHEESADCILSFPESTEYYPDSMSDSDSILNYGR